MEQTRYDKGLKTLEKIADSSVSAVVEGLKEIAPELVDWMIEFSYGDVLSRSNLDLRTRQLATVAALTAMGTATPQLKFHINGALNVGCKQDEIIEVILQMAVYAGFPATINGINATMEVLKNRKATWHNPFLFSDRAIFPLVEKHAKYNDSILKSLTAISVYMIVR